MTKLVTGLSELLDRYDAFVFDQWGVMHQGAMGYPGVAEAMKFLRNNNKTVVILSNSGRRANYNSVRLVDFGFGPETYDLLLTSGEALWLDAHSGKLGLPSGGYLVISQDDATTQNYIKGLDKSLIADDLDSAGGVILLALPDGTEPNSHITLLEQMAKRKMPLVCGNPDTHAPTDIGLHPAPGYVTAIYENMGGTVKYYGKPHPQVFDMVLDSLGEISSDRTLMIGDNIATDVAGASAKGMDTLLITKGVHAKLFEEHGFDEGVRQLVQSSGVTAPTYCAEVAVTG